MKWVKAPDELKILLEEVMKGFDCEKRPMFGYPAYFINSNMFVGLFQDQLFVRLSEAQLEELRAAYPTIANLEPMPGRPMKDYYVIPKKIHSKLAELSEIIAESAEHTRTLAPKVKKARKKK
jgi:TfoX/Sxy family transcriptional regulator of competence genes